MPEIETLRFVVSPADCDLLGHMNVSRYLAACGDAVFSIQTAMGLDKNDVLGGRRLSFAVVHADCQFRAEVHPGTVLHMRTGIQRIGTKTVTFYHRLIGEEGKTVFESAFKCALLDLETRKAAEIPVDIQKAANAFLVEPPG